MKLGQVAYVVGLALGLAAVGATAGVKEEVLAYKDGAAALEGFAAYKDVAGKRPVVLIVHAWKGLGDYEKRRARQLAELGYLAFALDMYGKGVRAKDRTEARRLSSIYRSDRALMRRRAQAALTFIRQHPLADAGRAVVMGYCFGGGVALELARSGAELRGTVSFHGNLDTPDPADAKAIKGSVLVLHGAADPVVPPTQVAAFQKEMTDAGVDWQFVAYSGAVHSFSDSASKGYQEKAAKRSWQAMKNFLVEVFAKP